MQQLTEMAKPFPKNFLGKDDRGNEAVDHTVVTQRLLQILGPYDLEVVEVLRTDVAGKKTQSNKEYAGGHFVTGVVLRLTVTIDGKRVSIDEVGGCENAAMKDGDGERMKHAMSDAIKRCAMRLGLGLHMWAQEHYFLYDKLQETSAEAHPPQPSKPQTGVEVSAATVGGSTASSPVEPKAGNTKPSSGAASPHDSGKEGSSPASGPSSLSLIEEALADKRLKQHSLTIKAMKVAAAHDAIPAEGLTSATIPSLPTAVLDEIAAELHLRQGELV